MDYTEITRVKAMEFYGLTNMPPKAKRGDNWSNAILKVMKTDGMCYYVIQSTDKKGNLCVIKDFETDHGIVAIVDAYPLERFDLVIIDKPLDKCDRGDIEKFVFNNGGKKENVSSLSDSDLREYAVRVLRYLSDKKFKTTLQ